MSWLREWDVVIPAVSILVGLPVVGAANLWAWWRRGRGRRFGAR